MKWKIPERHLVGRAIILAVAVGVACPAIAVTLTPATFYEFVSVGGNSAGGFPVTAGPGTEVVNEPTDYPRGTGTAIARTTNVHPLLAESSVVLDGKDSSGYGGSAEARINFQFSVEALPGGTPGTLVPVDITTSGMVMLDMTAGAAGGISGNAFAILGIPEVFTLTASRSCSGHLATGVSCSNSDPASFDGTFSKDLLEGKVYEGELHVGVHGQGGGDLFSTDAYAIVDPTFVVQSSFADQYQVVFSPGIVPVPGALVFLFSGIVGLGFSRRLGFATRAAGK